MAKVLTAERFFDGNVSPMAAAAIVEAEIRAAGFDPDIGSTQIRVDVEVHELRADDRVVKTEPTITMIVTMDSYAEGEPT